MKKKIWFVIIGLALLIGGGAYVYTFYKPHRDYKSEEAKHAVQAHEIHDLLPTRNFWTM
jgi:LPXTG-motif cell wall-anchored protein